MKYHRVLFSFLFLFFITGVSLAATFMQQDSQVQEKRQATKSEAGSVSDDKEYTKKILPFEGLPIVRIEFRGNEAFSSEKILNSLHFAKIGDSYRHELLQSDLDRMRVLLYVDSGYLQARFQEPEFENSLTGVKITIAVEEGVFYRAGEIEFKDAKLFSSEEILATIGLKKGDVIKGYSVINKGVEALKDKYRERGYVHFDVFFQPEFHAPALDSNEAIADVKFILARLCTKSV